MKRLLLAFAAGLTLAIPGAVSGAEPAANVPYPRHLLTVGPEVSAIHYEEPGYMEDDSVMYGAALDYRYSGPFMFGVTAIAKTGEAYYTGSGNMDTDNRLMELRARVGFDIIDPAGRSTVYAGYGYRYLEVKPQTRTTTTGARTYLRESNYNYVPVGIDGEFKIGEGAALKTNIEYDIFVSGRQESHLSEVSSYYLDVTNNQSSGFGFRGSVSVAKRFGESFVKEAELGVFIRYWDIGDSDKAACTTDGRYVCLEPENTSSELGIRLAVGF